MEIQKQILLFFASIHNSFLNLVGQAFTVMGEELVLISFSVFIFWCVDKKKGFGIVMSIVNSLCVMGIAKAIVRFPRPWTVIEGLATVRQQTATGYSFPSGHTTGAAAAYSATAVAFRKRWISIICAALILLVGISRMYLCVHWPLDVVGGVMIGCGMTFMFISVFRTAYDDKKRCCKILIWLGVAATLASLVMSILVLAGVLDPIAFEDLSITFAIYGGMAFGLSIERKVFDFRVEKGNWGIKLLRYAFGMIIIVLLLVLLKKALVVMGIYNIATRSLRYFCIGMWACVYPILGRSMGLFKGGKDVATAGKLEKVARR